MPLQGSPLKPPRRPYPFGDSNWPPQARLERDGFSSRSIFLFEHDLRANASRLSRGKTGAHPASSAGQAFSGYASADAKLFGDGVHGLGQLNIELGDATGVVGREHHLHGLVNI